MPDYKPMGRPERPAWGVEGPDISLKYLLISAGSILAVAVFFHFALGGLLWLFLKRPAGWVEKQRAQSPDAVGSQVPPTPRLRADPDALLAEIKAEQFGLLRSFGYRDPARNIVHIPIERAKALLLERGIPPATGPVPSPSPGPATPQAPQATPSPLLTPGPLTAPTLTIPPPAPTPTASPTLLPSSSGGPTNAR